MSVPCLTRQLVPGGDGRALPAAVPLHRMALTHLPLLQRDPRVPTEGPLRRGDNHQGKQPGWPDAGALQVSFFARRIWCSHRGWALGFFRSSAVLNLNRIS